MSAESSSNNLSIQLELLWWLFTAIATIGFLVPIYRTAPDYPFFLINGIFIVCFITLTRYLFLLRFTWLGTKQIAKAVWFFLTIPLVFYLVQEINYFQTFLDENGMEAILGNLPELQLRQLGNYTRSQIIFFGVGAVIAAVALAFRLLISAWRYHNTGKV